MKREYFVDIDPFPCIKRSAEFFCRGVMIEESVAEAIISYQEKEQPLHDYLHGLYYTENPEMPEWLKEIAVAKAQETVRSAAVQGEPVSVQPSNKASTSKRERTESKPSTNLEV